MNITEYASYFHDGSIIHIDHLDSTILISMETSELSEEDLHDDVELSEQNALKGILHLENVKSLSVDGSPLYTKLAMLADEANILRFEFAKNKVRFFVEWINFPPKKEINLYSDIIIEFDNFFWENSPHLPDPFR